MFRQNLTCDFSANIACWFAYMPVGAPHLLERRGGPAAIKDEKRFGEDGEVCSALAGSGLGCALIQVFVNFQEMLAFLFNHLVGVNGFKEI